MSLKDNFADDFFLSHLNHSKWNLKPISFLKEDKILNRLCGDEIHFFLDYQNNFLSKIFFQSESCSISKVSTSILLEEIQGKDFETVISIVQNFKKKFSISEKSKSNLDYLNKFQEYPTRKECVLLPFHFIEKFIIGEKNGIK